MLSNLSKREKVLLSIVGALVVLIFSLEFLWRDQIPRYRALQLSLQKEEQRLASARKSAETLPVLLEQREQARQRLSAIQLSFGGGLNNGAPLLELGSRLDGLFLEGVYPQEVEEKESYLVLPLKVKLKGTYTQVLDFIHAMESLPRAVEIRSLILNSQQSGVPGQVSADLLVAFYGAKGDFPPQVGGQWQVGRLDIFSSQLQDMLKDAARPPEQEKGPSGGTRSSSPPKPAPQPPQEPSPPPPADPYAFPVR